MTLGSAALKQIPAKIGKYQVESILGRGAMGVVYRAYDPFIKRRVAIKSIHASLLNTDMGQELLARFSKEAEAVGRLSHPNIVTIYDFDQISGVPYFVMEYVDGQELKALIQREVSERGRIPLEQAFEIVLKVLDGLAYVHQFGIVHRDIKPANIFILNDGGVKIGDFGIARLENSDYTQMGRVLGTPSYMSPEQCQGALLDVRSDLFSLALIFFEMVTGTKAFQGANAQETMHKVVNEPFERSIFKSVHLPAKLGDFFAKALAKRCEKRFQSADEFKQALLALSTQLLQKRGRIRAKAEGVSYFSPFKQKLISGVSSVALLSICSVLVVNTWQAQSNKSVEATATSATSATTHATSSQSVLGLSSKNAEHAALHGRTGRPDADGNAVVYTAIHTQGSAATPKVLSLSEQAKVNRLLKVAKAHLLVQRLVAPQGSNAYDAYQLVLKIDPDNQEAQTGLTVVEERLILRVQALQLEGKTAESSSYLQLGRKLFPNNRTFNQSL